MQIEHEAELHERLSLLSKSYLFILFNFSDFGKPQEDEIFFQAVHRLLAIVVRLEYGVAAQKRAEVEFGRVFHSRLFNNAEHKYRDDPDVQACVIVSEKASSRPVTIRAIRQASRGRSDLLATMLPQPPSGPLKATPPCQIRKNGAQTSRTPRQPRVKVTAKEESQLVGALNIPTPRAALETGSHVAYFA